MKITSEYLLNIGFEVRNRHGFYYYKKFKHPFFYNTEITTDAHNIYLEIHSYHKDDTQRIHIKRELTIENLTKFVNFAEGKSL